MKFLTGLTLFAATASAYQVLTPTSNSTVSKGSQVSVSWSSVDTDASDFSIYLVNFLQWPPVVLSLAQNVPQSDKSLSVRIPCSVNSGAGWQINFINGTNTYVIYAQSAAFSVIGDCVDPTSTSSTPAASTVTTTATIHDNSTMTATATTTKTVVQSVQTIVIESPVVWFVQPNALAAYAADGSCDFAQTTVTVYADGPAPVTCGGAGAYPTKAANPPVAYVNSTVAVDAVKSTSISGVASSTGSVVSPPTTTATTPVQFTGAASSVRVGASLVAIAGVVAMLM